MTLYRANRRSLLASVHIARKDLGLEEEAYRDVLEAVTGKRSAGDLKIAELVKVCTHFEKLGWNRGGAGAIHESPVHEGAIHESTLRGPSIQGREGTDRLLAKLRALSIAMGRPWPGYVGAILKRQGIERLEWAYPEDLRKVVAAMEYQKKREGKG